MKNSLLKLSLLSAVIFSTFQTQCNEKLAKHILVAIEKADPKQVRSAGNSVVKVNCILKKADLERKGLIFRALVENFFDENNHEPLSIHINGFSYFHNQLVKHKNSLPPFADFVNKIKSIQVSTNSYAACIVIKQALENLHKSLCNVNLATKNMANNIKTKLDAMVKTKGLLKLNSIIEQRLSNK